jgi:molybdenum cofactor cytidylyltransferase
MPSDVPRHRDGLRSAGLVLAAGASTRMGSPKQLLELDGRPLLEFVVTRVNASSLDVVFVVLGAAAERIRAAVDFGRARVVVNQDHATGMSSSLRAGLHALDEDVGRVVVVLGDQPGVDAGIIDRLLEIQSSSGLPAAALSIDGLLHPPVVMQRSLWPGLEALEGDIGFRRLIRAQPDLVAALPLGVAGNHPVDVDTPDDYQRLVSNL